MAGRYARVTHFKRRKGELRLQPTRLSPPVRDISRKIAGDPWLKEMFARPLYRAVQLHLQHRRRRDGKLCSLHAPRSNASARAGTDGGRP